MEGDISMNRENAWTTYEEADIKALEGLCKEYAGSGNCGKETSSFLKCRKDRT